MSTTTQRVMRPRNLMLGMMLAAGLIGGCKTDSLMNPKREAPPGPTTSLESPAGVKVPDIPVANRTEVDLVEELILHRATYARLLKALVTYYSENGMNEKATWAQTELNDLRRVKIYPYVLDAELPGKEANPSTSIAEADKLYQEAMDNLMKGGRKTPGLYNLETIKKSLAEFKELVDKYPKSDKVDDACFFIGEIHKEYFQEKDNSIALGWYKKALELNPRTPHPVRFQIAVLYDLRLHEREESLKWYNRVLTEEQDLEKTNTVFAKNRIRELTNEKTRNAPADMVTEPGAPPPAEPAK